MKLSLWVIGSIFLLSSAVYWVMSHPNREKAVIMEKDLVSLRAENTALDEKNKKLQLEIAAIRTDPRFIERRAREVAPLIKKGEKIYQFRRDDSVKEVEVEVVIKVDSINVGGVKTQIADLASVLNKMKLETKEAVFRLAIKDDDLEPTQRKRLEEIVTKANAKEIPHVP